MKQGTMRFIYTIATLVLLSTSAFSDQGNSNGVIKGTVHEEQAGSSIPVPFANVFLMGTSIGGSTDFDGNFEFSVSPGNYKLIVSSLGYKDDTVAVTVSAGGVVEKTIKVSADAALLEAVQIYAKANRESESMLLMEQKNASTITQSIGASELSKTGSSDVAQGVAKISGVAKSEASSDIFVRGLGDRYNTASLNGLPIPSSNPDRKVIDLGIFPTSVVKSIDVNKTFTPNLPADFAGASININTKDYYENPFAQVGFSASYNSITNGKEFLRSQKIDGSLIPFSFDNRALSDEVTVGYERAYYTSPADDSELPFERKLNPTSVLAMPNFGSSVLGGNSYNLGEQSKLGFLFSAETATGNQYREGFAKNTDSSGVDKSYFATESFEHTTKSTALANVLFEITPRNIIQVNGLYTENSSDVVSNYDSEILDRDRNTYTYSTRNTLQVNNLRTIQIIGDHKSENEDFLLSWGASHNKANNAEPDRIQLLYEASDVNKDDYRLEALNASDNHRFFSAMTEEDINARIDVGIKFNKDDDTVNSKGLISFGVQPRIKSRTFEWRQFNMDMRQYADSLQSNDIVVDQLNPDKFLGQEAYANGLYSYKEARDGSRTHFANQTVMAGYLMIDYAITTNLMAVFGARIEHTSQTVQYKQLRNLLSEPYQVKEYDTLNVLPSLTLKYNLTEKSNLRFALSQTVSRPNFRELAPFQYQDQSRRLYEGNVDLKNGYSYNADLKYEFFPEVGEVFAISAFGKYIDNPIERYEVPSSTTLFTYFNLGRAIVAGLEAEVKTTIGRFIGESDLEKSRVIDRVTLGVNAAYNYTPLYVGTEEEINTSKGTILATNSKRQMQGASPYILSADIGYSFKVASIKSRWAIVYNVFGPRVFLAGTYGRGDVYERPVNTVDIVLRNTISERIDVNLNVRNLLNPKIIQEQTNAGQTFVFNEYRIGTTAGLSVNYRFFKQA
jgi:outer membrane receptor protein involved in Fe transport